MNPLTEPSNPPRRRGRTVVILVASLVAVVFGLSLQTAGAGASTTTAAHAVQDPAPSGNSGTTIDPLQYNCGNDAPTCGQVGESNGYYNGTDVDLLYSENFFCDATPGVVSAARPPAARRCTGPAPPPSGAFRATGTTLGNTTHGDTLYIPVPLFTPAPATQCTATATCIDHPPTIDLSQIAGALPGSPNPTTLYNMPDPGPRPVVSTRNNGLPEWWNVKVVPIASLRTFDLPDRKSLTSAQMSAGIVATNVFLFFQVLPGTLFTSMAADLTATAPPGRPCLGSGPSAGQPDRVGHDVQQPKERLRSHRTQLPEPRHQPRLDPGSGRGGAVLGAVLLRQDGVGGIVIGL